MIKRARELPFNVKVLLATNAVSALGGGLVLPFLWLYLTNARHLDPWVPAMTLVIQAVTAVVGGMLWGSVVDQLPQRVVVPAVMVVAGLGTALYAIVSTPPLAVVAAVLYGLGISGVGIVLRVMYAATTEPSQRELVFSLDYAILNVMMGLGVVIGGLVVVADFGSPADRYAVLYLADALTFFVTAIVTALLLSAEKGGRAIDPAASRQQSGYLTVLRDRRLLLLLVAMLLLMVVSVGQFRSGIPGYLNATGAVGAGGISFAFALNIVVVVSVQFILMPYLGRIHRVTLLAVSGLLFTLAWACFYLAGSHSSAIAITLASAGIVLLSIGEAVVVPVLTTLLNNLVSDELRGRANALLSITLSASSVLAPLIAAAALPWHQGSGLIAVMIAGSVLATLVVLKLRSQIPAPSTHVGERSATEPASA